MFMDGRVFVKLLQRWLILESLFEVFQPTLDLKSELHGLFSGLPYRSSEFDRVVLTKVTNRGAAGQLDASTIGLDFSNENLEQRRFAGSVSPDKRDLFASFEAKSRSSQNVVRPIRFDDLGNVEQHVASLLGPSARRRDAPTSTEG